MDPMPSRAARTAYLVLTVFLGLAILAGLIQVTHRLLGFGQDSGFLTFTAHFSVSDVRLPERFEIAGPLPLNVDIVDPSLTQRLIATAPPLVWWGLAVFGLWLLRRVARSAARGDPFIRSNAARLRWLGAIFLVGYPLVTVVQSYSTELLFSEGVWAGGPLPLGGVAISYPVVSATAILAAISLFALAEVFAYGARLREDVDATI
jgi:hypothetical protein